MTTNEDRAQLLLRRFASCLGVIQSVTWVILCAICIGLYYDGPVHEPFEPFKSYMDQVSYNLYTVFLNPDSIGFPDQAFEPTVFHGFMWVYLIVDIVWLLTSIRVFSIHSWGLQLSRRMRFWSHLTFLICLIDFITVVILGSDYHKCINLPENLIISTLLIEERCANLFLPVLVIAAKGFVLWFVNVIFAVVMHNMSRQQHLKSLQDNANRPVVVQPVQPVYPPTGYPANPQIGYPTNPPTGYQGNPQTGYSPNPQSGYSPNPQTGYPPNPQTGYPAHPQTGYPAASPTGYPEGSPSFINSPTHPRSGPNRFPGGTPHRQ